MTDALVGLAKQKGYYSFHTINREVGDGWYIELCLFQRWLREKHGIDIWIQPTYLNKAIGSSVKTGYIINGGPSEEFDTYEQALEDALLTGLKLIE